MEKVANLTPHPITILGEEGNNLTIPSAGVVRIVEEQKNANQIYGFSVRGLRRGQLDENSKQLIDDLVNRGFDMFIVSRVAHDAVLNYCREKGYQVNVVFPDQFVRDNNGRVMGCKGFACYVESQKKYWTRKIERCLKLRDKNVGV